MLAYAPMHTVNTALLAQEIQSGALDPQVRSRGTSATGADGLPGLQVGATRYDFLKRIQLRHSWDSKQWICWAPALGSHYVGHGDTPFAAHREWEDRVHAEFQRLYAMRPFEMEQDEKSKWQLLLSIIDVHQYRENTPLELRQIGQVRWGRFPYPKRVIWIDGREDQISLDRVPGEVAGYKTGQWFEADVKRDPKDNRLIEITHAARMSHMRRLGQGEVDQYWESLPRAELPQSELESLSE